MEFAYCFSDSWFRISSVDPSLHSHPAVPCSPLGVRLTCPWSQLCLYILKIT